MSIRAECPDCCNCPEALAVKPGDVTISATCRSLTTPGLHVCGFFAFDDGSYDAEHPESWNGRGRVWMKKQITVDNRFDQTITGWDGANWPAHSTACDTGDATRTFTDVRYCYISGTYSYRRRCDTSTETAGSVTEESGTGGVSAYFPSPWGDTVPSFLSSTCYSAAVDGDDLTVNLGYSAADVILTGSYTKTITTETATLGSSGTGCYSYIKVDGSATINTQAELVSELTPQDGADWSKLVWEGDADGSELVKHLSGGGEITEGDFCRAETPVLGETYPDSEGTMTYGGSLTSVRVTITVTGEPETDYPIRITYDNSSGPATTETLTVTTDGDGVAEIELDVPQPGAGEWRGFAGATLITDEYDLIFPRPKIGAGKCLRAEWVERVIDGEGVSLKSVTSRKRGVFRPLVGIAAPPGGGITAQGVAVMGPTGAVTAIHITNPGSGYTSPPLVKVQTVINGGATSTGWTASLVGSGVGSITGGTGGDYLPTLEFGGGEGVDAAATCTLDMTGGIYAVTLTDEGSGYTSEPTLTVTAKVLYPYPADLLIHMGVEVAKCDTWDGEVPEEYDPLVSESWPSLPRQTLRDPVAKIANLRTVCDCSSCP